MPKEFELIESAEYQLIPISCPQCGGEDASEVEDRDFTVACNYCNTKFLIVEGEKGLDKFSKIFKKVLQDPTLTHLYYVFSGGGGAG